MNKYRHAYRLNLWIVGLELFAVGWMFSGLNIMGAESTLTGSRFGIFKYFTVDSNILMGVLALIIALDLKKVFNGGLSELPKRDYVLALMGTTMVSLTMLVTVFYLAPTLDNGWYACFNNSNIFLHVINPVISIVTFLGYERTQSLRIRDAVLSLTPMCVYAVFYIGRAIIYSEGGMVLDGYDFYHFFIGGLRGGFVVFPIIVVLTFGISAGLYRINKTLAGK